MARRVLMYSQDGLGLGHFRRSSNIAEAILAREPDAEILILADSPAPQFAPARGIDFIKLPTVVKIGRGQWSTGSSGMDVEDVMHLRSGLIEEVYRYFRPDSFLIDHMPTGALGELCPTLDRIAAEALPTRLVLGLRDVLDDPATIRRSWSEAGVYERLPQFDSVLVYGCRHIYDAEAEYGLEHLVKRVVFCNYVGPRLAAATGTDDVPDAPFVLMMGGGGHDAEPLAQMFLESAPGLATARGLSVVAVAGPTMAAAARERLMAHNHHDGISVLPSVTNPSAWIRAASAVVTMAGYNSLCEVLATGKPALVVPRRGPSREQRIRCRLFADHRLIEYLDPQDLTVENLVAGIEKVLVSNDLPHPETMPPLDGADRAAAEVLGFSRTPHGRSGGMNGHATPSRAALDRKSIARTVS